MSGSANLNIMVKAVRRAGRSLVKDFREVENLQVSMKGAGDFVSKADFASEAILKDELMGARPNYGWHAEESDDVDGADSTRRWIVDPLDGTTNFLHGLPHWAISIALEHKGEVVERHAASGFGPAPDDRKRFCHGASVWRAGGFARDAPGYCADLTGLGGGAALGGGGVGSRLCGDWPV